MTNGGDSSSKIDVSSPCYLGPQDQPGDSITPVRLTLDNFDEWSHEVRLALNSCRKYVFVNGVINEPKAPCMAEDWKTIHSMLVSWLSHTITPEIRALLPKFENAKSLWDALLEQFSVVDGSRIQQLKVGLQECRQTDNIVNGHIERRESDRLHQFLLGLLPTPYSSLRFVILAQTSLPTVARAFHMLCQEDRVRSVDKNHQPTSEIASFNVHPSVHPPTKPPSQMTRTQRQQLYCNHCKRGGHDRRMCFDLLREIPDWYSELKATRHGGSGRGGSSGHGRGGGRGSGGCPRDEGSSSRSEGTMSEASSSVQTTSAASSVEATPPASASMINVYGTPTHVHSGKWLIDTGCSHHVTGNYSLLYDVRNIPNRIVGLPDGSKIFASQIGRVDVTPTISLDPILYVPQLTCNQISASQLSDALNCELITNATLCTIQNRATSEAIGTGERLDGLYYIRQGPEEINVVAE
ncbi:uncharacterized protein LOC141632754 [Silene latifolia]|uniref:uncharacterized protein LOC141632754 n=1 Tax=Silene latifolia TaxID=37657 RepID=UPI003D76A939